MLLRLGCGVVRLTSGKMIMNEPDIPRDRSAQLQNQGHVAVCDLLRFKEPGTTVARDALGRYSPKPRNFRIEPLFGRIKLAGEEASQTSKPRSFSNGTTESSVSPSMQVPLPDELVAAVMTARNLRSRRSFMTETANDRI